jgi:ABC-type transporter Mla MlaB component
MDGRNRAVLELAGVLVGVTTYDLMGRVERLHGLAGQTLTVDISALTDIDVSSLAALRELLQTLRAQRIAVQIAFGDTPTGIRDAVSAVLAADA